MKPIYPANLGLVKIIPKNQPALHKDFHLHEKIGNENTLLLQS